jgi:hypothetical protein
MTMTRHTILLTAILLTFTSGSQADELNGTIQGTVDAHAIDVAVACNREKLGNANWLTAYSDPSMHGGLEDRNGDGMAISVSSNGERAIFEVLVAEQRYRLSVEKDAVFNATGIEVQSIIKRYEGMGRDQKVVGEYGVDLKLTCP